MDKDIERNEISVCTDNWEVMWGFVKYSVFPFVIVVIMTYELFSSNFDFLEQKSGFYLFIIAFSGFSFYLVLYIRHILVLIRNKNQYLILDRNGIRSPYRDFSVSWRNVYHANVKRPSPANRLGWESFTIMATRQSNQGKKQDEEDLARISHHRHQSTARVCA